MAIDLSGVNNHSDEIIFDLFMVLGVPTIIAMVLGILLIRIKIPNKLVQYIAPASFLYSVYLMFKYYIG